MANSSTGGVWRTIGGRRIFIKDGSNLSSAMKESGKFKSKKKKLEELQKEYDSIQDMFSPRKAELRDKIDALKEGKSVDKYKKEQKEKEQKQKQEYLKEKEERLSKENNKQSEKNTSQTSSEKEEQFEIIQKNNPMQDDYHVGIRSPEDIKTWEEAMNDEDSFAWGDFSKADAEKALKEGEITIYSSYDIKQGTFVSTSKAQAEEYAGGKGSKVYERKVPLNEVAWINGDEGQYAKIGNKTNSNNEMLYHGTSLNSAFKIQKQGLKPKSAIGAETNGSGDYNYFTNSKINAKTYQARKDSTSGQLLRVAKTDDMKVDDRIQGHKKGEYDIRTKRVVPPEEIQIQTYNGYWTPIKNYDLYLDTPNEKRIINKSLLYDDYGNKVNIKKSNSSDVYLKAYNEYKKQHPNSKITFAKFKENIK